MIVSNRRHMFGLSYFGVVKGTTFGCAVCTAPEGIFKGCSTVFMAFDGDKWSDPTKRRLVAKAMLNPSLSKEQRAGVHDALLTHLDELGNSGADLASAIDEVLAAAKASGVVIDTISQAHATVSDDLFKNPTLKEAADVMMDQMKGIRARLNQIEGNGEENPQKKKVFASPFEIAKAFHLIGAVEDDPQAAPEAFHLPEVFHARFREKVFLYREANGLLALLIWAKQDPLFEQPLREYERLLFPETPTPAGLARLQAVKAAMQDLEALADAFRTYGEGGKPLTWTSNWLAAIGYKEINPITFHQLSYFWISGYITAHETLKELIALSEPMEAA